MQTISLKETKTKKFDEKKCGMNGPCLLNVSACVTNCDLYRDLMFKWKIVWVKIVSRLPKIET